jgi:hypothetical protein
MLTGRNSEILALRVLAEVDLNRTNFYCDTCIKLTGSLEYKKYPYQILLDRGIIC